MTWVDPVIDVLKEDLLPLYSPLAHIVDAHLLGRKQRRCLLLPNLRDDGNETIGVFSDYSGESDGPYLVYSILVCGWNHSFGFLSEMEPIRTRYGLADKEISFKDFRYGPISRGLRAYLRALDTCVVGLLYTLVVDKALGTLFRVGQSQPPHEVLAEEGYRWPPRAAEKLLRVTHTAAYLTALLSREGQKVFWMTDHDDIAANDKMHQQALEIFQGVLAIYAKHSFGLISGAVPFAERSTGYLDLLSATDVVAGSLAFHFSERTSMAPATKKGAEEVLRWLQHDGIGLKKMTVIVRKEKDGSITAADLVPAKLEIPDHVTVVPIRV